MDPSTLQPMFQGLAEPDAEGHWLFGSDNPTMADMISGHLMTPRLSQVLTAGGSGYTVAPTLTRVGSGQSVPQTLTASISGGAVNGYTETDPGSADATAAGTVSVVGGGTGAVFSPGIAPAPTHGAGTLTLADATTNRINGYQTPFEIKRDQTVCLAVKRKALANTTMIVGWWPAGVTRAPLWMVQVTAANYVAFSRSASGNFSGDGQAVAPPAGAVGDWLFLAVTHDAAGARRIDWGNGPTYNQAGVLGLSDPNHRVGIGSNVPAYAGGGEFAELMVFPAAKTASQVAAIYARSKERLLARGITLL
ncbi:MAG: hypothetical protein E5W70_03520 [Mesorhizobium sp.]|uniref:hypothetical protein n=1 Tax=Mesorhizobium sp. TaxID=1871066 RepID=UPI001201D1F1|nr:hypothetical protein [Mesorhizobium sp.]TIT24394.1 MAG: hypothetical protein E5W70_03520 [Mesorhizobium sp.]